MMEFDRERAGPLPQRTNAQTHKRTKTQKHKNTETQKHRNTVYSGTPIFLVYCPFYCQHMNVLETCNGQPWHWLLTISIIQTVLEHCYPVLVLLVASVVFSVGWYCRIWGLGVFYFGGETQTHRNTNAQKHKRTNAQTHKRTLAQTHKRTLAQIHIQTHIRLLACLRDLFACI